MLAVHGAFSRGTFAVVVLISVAVLFAPGDDVPSAPPGVDKLVHLGLFAALALAGRWAGVRARQLALLLVGYAVASELIQAMAPLQRTGSFADGAADAVGIALGILVWAGSARRLHRG